MATAAGQQVPKTGLGLMGLSWRPNPQPLEETISLLRNAVEMGNTFWNGGEFYGVSPDYNTMTIIREYFSKYPEDASKVTIAIKGGVNLDTIQAEGSAASIRRSLDNIIKQLDGKKKLDIFVIARRDAKVPLTETLGTIKQEYIDMDKIGGVALSEVAVPTLEEALKCDVKIEGVEIEMSMFTPDPLKNGVAALAGKHNIPIWAYSPLGRGMLTGQFRKPEDVAHLGPLSHLPRFQAMEHNLKLTNKLQEICEKKGCTSAQLALAWVRAQGSRNGNPPVIPLAGSTTVARMKENFTTVELADSELKQLDDLVDGFKPEGDRYPPGFEFNT